jgi:hypothetical protein
MGGNRISRTGLYMNVESTKPVVRTRIRWKDEVTEDGIIVSGGVWQEKVYNREEWKKVLRNTRILYMDL